MDRLFEFAVSRFHANINMGLSNVPLGVRSHRDAVFSARAPTKSSFPVRRANSCDENPIDKGGMQTPSKIFYQPLENNLPGLEVY